MKWVVLDFETASACDLKKAGSARYAEDPTTEVLCAVYETQAGVRSLWLPSDGNLCPLALLAADPDVWLVAHNAGFEKDIWRNIMAPLFGFPPVPNSRWHDTMAVAAYKAIPQGLEWCARVLNLPQQKDTEGTKITIAMSRPDKRGYYDRSPEKLKRVYDYCTQDIATQVGVHQALGWLPREERQVWLLDQRINERGVRLDMAYVEACQKIVDEASAPLAEEFGRITGGLKMSQVAKVGSWLINQGVCLPDMRKETLAEVLGEVEEEDYEELSDNSTREGATLALPGHVHRALHIRQLIGSASIKKLGAMAACACADGRARRLLQYHGTGPGRWAGRLLQPQNFPRPTLEIENAEGKTGSVPIDLMVETLKTGDWRYVEATLGPAVETVVSGLRHALVADPSRVFVSGDYAGIQARVVLALAGQHDKTTLMAAGADIYCDMASQIYKREITKKADPEARQTGKNAVLGLGFQMGPPKFKLKYGKGQPLEFIQEVVRVYRQEWAPGVPRLWRDFLEASTRAVHEGGQHETHGCTYELEGGWLSCRLPNEKKIWYRDPRPTFKPMPWDEHDVRPGWSFKCWKMGHWVTRDAFGGLLTENNVMGIERGLMTDAMFELEKNGFPLVMNAHDEWLAEPKKEDADMKAFEQIMVDIKPWARSLKIPVAVECWTGDRYRK